MYVTDTSDSRIEKFDSSGTYITQWGTVGSGNGQFTAADGIATRPDRAPTVSRAGLEKVHGRTWAVTPEPEAEVESLRKTKSGRAIISRESEL